MHFRNRPRARQIGLVKIVRLVIWIGIVGLVNLIGVSQGVNLSGIIGLGASYWLGSQVSAGYTGIQPRK